MEINVKSNSVKPVVFWTPMNVGIIALMIAIAALIMGITGTVLHKDGDKKSFLEDHEVTNNVVNEVQDSEIVVNKYPPAAAMMGLVQTVAIGKHLDSESNTFNVTEIHITVNGTNHSNSQSIHYAKLHTTGFFGVYGGQSDSNNGFCFICALPTPSGNTKMFLSGVSFQCLRQAQTDSGGTPSVYLGLSPLMQQSNKAPTQITQITDPHIEASNLSGLPAQNKWVSYTKGKSNTAEPSLATQQYLYILHDTSTNYQGEFNGLFEIKLYITHYTNDDKARMSKFGYNTYMEGGQGIP